MDNNKKNQFYFDDFEDDNIVEHRRKYNNDWTGLREFVDLDHIELVDNELVIINMKGEKKLKRLSPKGYNVLRMIKRIKNNGLIEV